MDVGERALAAAAAEMVFWNPVTPSVMTLSKSVRSTPPSTSSCRSGCRVGEATRSRSAARPGCRCSYPVELTELLPVQRLVARLADGGPQLERIDERPRARNAVRRRPLGIVEQLVYVRRRCCSGRRGARRSAAGARAASGIPPAEEPLIVTFWRGSGRWRRSCRS